MLLTRLTRRGSFEFVRKIENISETARQFVDVMVNSEHAGLITNQDYPLLGISVFDSDGTRHYALHFADMD
jgi:hypothetical protein